MRKQYVVKEGATFRLWITTYHDGVKIQNDKVWLDDYADFVDKLEAEGYERAYTKEEVQEAKEEYERLLARQLMEEAR
jgi:hypothetical protein